LFQYDDSKALVRYLEERNIFVRDRTSQFDGVGHVRISVGGKESTEAAIRTLDQFFSNGNPTKSETAREESLAGASPSRLN